MGTAVDPSPLGSRSPIVAVVGVALGVVTVAALVVLSVWAVVQGDDAGPDVEVLVAEAAFPAAVAPTPDGGLLYGERLTGRVRRVDAEGRVATEPVAVVDVGPSPEGQRGLLGLTVDPDDPGRVFAAWTRASDGRLVVGQVAPGPERLVWEGPVSAELANGGRVLWRDGRLVVGIGDLLDGERTDDPSAPNGKVISLDPDGPADQPFEVLSSGWNNPFALALDAEGRVWVADNAGGAGFERFGRADIGDATRSDLVPADEPVAPAGLVALADGRFAVCGYVSRELVEVEVDAAGEASYADEALAPCAVAVVQLADGRVVVADETSLSVVAAP